MTKLYVVRHAHAGRRSAWNGVDHERPLSRSGRRQAAAIAERLTANGHIGRLVSSPALRCLQTLEPLAERADCGIDRDARLLEGATSDDALALATELARTDGCAAVCSHGDVIPDLLRRLRTEGTRLLDPLLWPKGSIWVVTWDGNGRSTARYVPPPEI